MNKITMYVLSLSITNKKVAKIANCSLSKVEKAINDVKSTNKYSTVDIDSIDRALLKEQGIVTCECCKWRPVHKGFRKLCLICWKNGKNKEEYACNCNY